MTISLLARPLWSNKYAHLIILLTVYGLSLWTYFQTAFGAGQGHSYN